MPQTHSTTRWRQRHRDQRGLTLPELLITIVILTAIGGSMAGAFTIGLRVLAPGGVQARLTGNHDLLAFEQQIGADIARSICLAAPSASPTTVPSVGCTNSVPSKCSGNYVLCLAWRIPGSTTCHTVSYIPYTQPSGTVVILRRDPDPTTGSGIQFTLGNFTLSASWLGPNGSPLTKINGYSWPSQVSLVVTQKTTPGEPTANPAATTTLYTVPLASDPSSPVSGGTAPC